MPIQEELHHLIKTSDLKAFKKKIDTMQSSLLHFDDPSLLMMAIEVYLDPDCLLNREYQKEMIVFLIKVGLRLTSPKGEILLYLMNKCQYFDQNHPESEEDLEAKLIEVVDCLLDNKMTNILVGKIAHSQSYQKFQHYILRHQSALKIQSWWRGWWTRKQLSDQKLTSQTTSQTTTEQLTNELVFRFE